MTDLMKLFAEMDSMGVDELMRQSWSRAFGIMRHLKRDGKFCDVTLLCEMAPPPNNRNSHSPPLGLVAHKVVLVSWSGYFRNLMDVGLFEEVEVMVPGVSHRALAWLLDLMYGETQPAVNEDNVDQIFQAAMILQVPLAVSLCAQMMKQRRRGSFVGDIVSSTIPEVDARESNSSRHKQSNIDHGVRGGSGLPTLQRAVKLEPQHQPPTPDQDCQSSSTSSALYFPKSRLDQDHINESRNTSYKNHNANDSDGDDCLDSNSNQRNNSPYRPFEIPPPSLVNASPKRQIISATRTPIFKPKSRNGPRPIAAKNGSSQDNFRQSSASFAPPLSPTSQPGESAPPPPPPPAPTLFVPMSMPISMPMSSSSLSHMPSTSGAFRTGMVGGPGLSMAALGALQLAPILVSSSSAPLPPHVSISPEGDAGFDEGRLVINEDDQFDEHKAHKTLKVRAKREKMTGMELVPVADESLEGPMVHHTPKGNLTIVAICNICQKGFTSKTGYKKHVRTHMGAFPYHCPVCNKGYFDHYTLQEHLNAHKGLKVHGCSGCGKKYQRKKNLVIHQRNCSGVPETGDVEMKEDGSVADGSEVRVLSDGPWSENGSESLNDEDDRGSMTNFTVDDRASLVDEKTHFAGDVGAAAAAAVAAAAAEAAVTGRIAVKEEGEEEGEEDGVMIAESGKGMILLSPSKQDSAPLALSSLPMSSSSAPSSTTPLSFSSLTSNIPSTSTSVLLPKGTLIKQLLKEESKSPLLARQHLQQLQLQQQQLQQQKAVDERPKPASAFASSTSSAPAVSAQTNGVFGATSGGSASPAPRQAMDSSSIDSSTSEDAVLLGASQSVGKEKFQERFQCPHCEDILTGRKNLQDHLAKVHAQPEKFTCPTCGRIFKYMTSLAHHIQTVCHTIPDDSKTASPKTSSTTSLTTSTSSSSTTTTGSNPAFDDAPSSPPPTPLTPPPSAPSSNAQTSPLTPSRKSRRISKRNSGGGPGLENGDDSEVSPVSKRRVLQMGGAESGDANGGYVILSEDN